MVGSLARTINCTFGKNFQKRKFWDSLNIDIANLLLVKKKFCNAEATEV